jgi:hypothetical protein
MSPQYRLTNTFLNGRFAVHITLRAILPEFQVYPRPAPGPLSP